MSELEQAAAGIRELNSRLGWTGLGRADLWVTTFPRSPPGHPATGHWVSDLGSYNQSSRTQHKGHQHPHLHHTWRRANRMYFMLDSYRSWGFFIIIKKNTKNISSLTFDLALVLAIKSLSSSERKEIHLRWPSGQGRYLSATWVRRQER